MDFKKGNCCILKGEQHRWHGGLLCIEIKLQSTDKSLEDNPEMKGYTELNKDDFEHKKQSCAGVKCSMGQRDSVLESGLVFKMTNLG